MDMDEFKEFVDPKNHVSRILIVHFIAVQMIVAPIIDREWHGRSKTTPVRAHLDWIFSAYDAVPPLMRRYVEWPHAIATAIKDEISGKQTLLPTVSILRRKEGLSRGIV